MGENSKIEWCHHTFNPWIGCSKVSEGCAHCYAEHSTRARILRHQGHETWGKGAARALTSDDYWKQPLNWNRIAPTCRLLSDGPWKQVSRAEKGRIRIVRMDGVAGGSMTVGEWDALPSHRPRVFCASLADWLDDEVPIEWLARLMELIMLTPHLDWLLLTKRPQNWERRITDALAEVEGIKGDWPDHAPETKTGTMLNDWLGGSPPTNVWIGTTVENQARADERIPILLSIPAKVRFLSCEPLLGPLDFWPPAKFPHAGAMTSNWNPKGLIGIHWIIAGGESGPQARPMHPDWARSLRDQCADANVPFFFKQWGNWFEPQTAAQNVGHGAWLDASGKFTEPKIALEDDDETEPDLGEVWMVNIGKAKAGRLLDGREYNGFPNLSHIERSPV